MRGLHGGALRIRNSQAKACNGRDSRKTWTHCWELRVQLDSARPFESHDCRPDAHHADRSYLGPSPRALAEIASSETLALAMACAAPVHTPEICPWAQAALQADNLNKISWGPSLRIAVSNKTIAWSVACSPGAHICLGRQPPSRLACIRCSHLHARRRQNWAHERYRSRECLPLRP